MCFSTDHANRIEVCKLSDLEPGAQYRVPDGDSVLVTECLFDGPTDSVQTVNIRTGRIAHVRGDTKLGRDRQGRLYASRYLNPAAKDASDDLGGEG